MSPNALAATLTLVAYLVGAIPFAYLLVKAKKGVDIRTVGSGNVGATNAGRLLGMRYFVLIFLLDAGKGLLPTILFPLLVRRLTGAEVPDLNVMVALAAIAGHNFPIYLGFRGGKGVATSLGAAFGLDPVAALVAVITFGVLLKVRGYVSLASQAGALAFVLTHFLAVAWIGHASPFDRDHFVFSVLILVLLGMLIVRHRHNWARIREGTEPRVGRGFRKPPSGRVALVMVLLIGAAGLGSLVVLRWSRVATVDCGAFALTEVARARTGHQRADRITFADSGKRLAVTCPRYDRLMIFAVGETSLDVAQDVELSGQPMAVVAGPDRFWVLIRPSGDRRHIDPGYLQGITFDGKPVGSPITVGFYPVDLALSPNGRQAYALIAGRAEGNAIMPPPALVALDLEAGAVLGRVDFETEGDDPTRVTLSSQGWGGAVTLPRSREVVAVDLSDPTHPRAMQRSALPPRDVPYPSISGEEWILMPVASDREAVVISGSRSPAATHPLRDYLISTLPEDSAIEIRRVASSSILGRLPLRGAANLGVIRPTGLAVCPDRNLLAVASRSGGIHLVAIQPTAASLAREVALAPR